MRASIVQGHTPTFIASYLRAQRLGRPLCPELFARLLDSDIKDLSPNLYYVAFCVASAGPCAGEACACTIYIGWTSTLSSWYEL